ncbi:DUF1707 SHOCT-like domain-containing protein [Kribbella sp. CA-293567]|uniref:DUF1707 SHOCT-like domain-containing protein n=1 Tax=Kribbella sp. CA-293567 TaxID=3002436 RepID=UPI0022DD1333|nr:DUF1707 domain-containing protein [Kribbella sp. CA-293567]WBQ06692.1 DUF1707 domain-containing protein [Kribbella sp. CA-293567]
MSDHLPARGGSLRIGDAERDLAVSGLSEHFVAGRLTQEEFEERSGHATKARYADEVDALFADLPELVPAHQSWTPGRPPWAQGQTPLAQGHPSWAHGRQPRVRVGPPPPFLWIFPVLMVGLVVSSVVLTAPWLLWMLFWFAILSGPIRHRRFHHGHRRG